MAEDSLARSVTPHLLVVRSLLIRLDALHECEVRNKAPQPFYNDVMEQLVKITQAALGVLENPQDA